MLSLSKVEAQGSRQRRLCTDHDVVDSVRAKAAIPLPEGVGHSVPVRRANVGDVYVEFVSGLGVEEACVSGGGKFPFTRVDQVENENFMPLVPQETKGGARGVGIYQKIGQEDHQIFNYSGREGPKKSKTGGPKKLLPKKSVLGAGDSLGQF